MKLSKYRKIVFSLAAGILLLVGLFLVLRARPIQATAGILYVSSIDPACGGQSPCYTTIQDAVDAASDGDIIKVAVGVYTGVQTRAHITQVVYLSKSLAIQGGYTTADWNTSDPDVNSTTLDAQGLGRGLVVSDTITATVEGLRIAGGNAAGLGGGIPLGSDAGGGVYVYAATVAISKCVIYSNTASTVASGYGGGLYLGNSTAKLSANKVQDNMASTADSGRGGGVYLAHSTAILTGNTVQGSTASTATWGDGGGLYLWYSDAILSGNTVQGNTASTAGPSSGGGIYLAHSTAILTGNTVQGNTAGTTPGIYYGSAGDRLELTYSAATFCGEVVIYGQGGGLSFSSSTATLSENTIISNTASTRVGGSGGGLSFSSSTATLNENIVRGNTASTGAGLYSGGVGGGLELRYSTAILSGNIVQGNTASTASSGYGGGLYLWGSDATLSGNTLHGNTASTADCAGGGGLSFGNGDATLNDNMIISNTATMNHTASGQGGGLWIRRGSSFTLTNNLVAGNHASSEGSGLWFEGEAADPTSGSLHHTTIADNSGGSGQGVYVGDYTTLAFTNTIIAGHDNVGITVTTGSTATLEATLWYNNGSQIGGGGNIFTGTINLDADPRFANAVDGNYHLLNSSPAIGAGTPVGAPPADLEGNPRPDPPGSNPDMGAYENPLASAQPVAAFTAWPLSGIAPLNVQFTSQACGEIDTWNWDFGDGGSSAEQSPVHAFTMVGTFTITFTVSGPSGSDTEAKAGYITTVQGYRYYLPIILRTVLPPPPPTKPQYQFGPAPWYAGERNDSMVRFYGYIRDTNDTPVNGYCIRAACGDFAVLSFPSGPSPIAPDWAPGWYDIVTDPVSCDWTLQVVEYQCNTPGFFDPQCTQYETLSEAIPVTTDVAAGETIVIASWIKFW